tara:strand:- start:105 stop:269 length:165 start_codon:yes stop_codon:yes gene_type:complete
MGVANDLVGSSVSGLYLGVTVVIAVATYSMVRGSGLPFVGTNGNGGIGDVFGGG